MAKKSRKKAVAKGKKKQAPQSTKKPAKKSAKKQTTETKIIGVLHTGTKTVFEELVEKMRQAAADANSFDVKIKKDGKVEGHYAGDDLGKLEDDADELVNDKTVKVIVAAGGPQSAIAAMNAAEEAGVNKPIVFTTVADPVGLGLVDDLEFPGGNLTGMAGQTSETDPERLSLLYEYISPGATDIKYGVLVNPSRNDNRKQFKRLEARARKLKIKLVRARTNSAKGIERAFQFLKKKDVLGVVVTADSLFNNNRKEVTNAATLENLPAIYQWRQFVVDGGLISFGPKIEDAYVKAGEFVKTILKEENVPAEMACSKPDEKTFELVVNTETASRLQLGIVPDSIGGRKVNEKIKP